MTRRRAIGSVLIAAGLVVAVGPSALIWWAHHRYTTAIDANGWSVMAGPTALGSFGTAAIGICSIGMVSNGMVSNGAVWGVLPARREFLNA